MQFPTENPNHSSLYLRGEILHFLSSPTHYQHFEDGLIEVQHGKIASIGAYHQANIKPGIELHDHRGKLIMPGLIDTHIHYPQVDVIASPGKQLLNWLNDYTFPAEQAFSSAEQGDEVSDFFLTELLRNGTTTAHVFCTVHEASAQAFFSAAKQRNMRMVAGKVLMDRNAPDFMLEPAQQGYELSRKLIQQWHGKGRLSYALTPRFAPTSTDEQLRLTGLLAQEFPTVTVHTHLAENRDEIAWVAQLFPKSKSYLDVYDQHGLLRKGSVFAHCVWLDDDSRRSLQKSGAAVAFSPSSNLFLGSGLYDLASADQAGVLTALATDVGGGTSYSMLQTLAEAYKVQQLKGHYFDVWRAFYMVTQGGAKALMLDDCIGNFEVGKEFDCILVDMASTPVLQRRSRVAKTLEERLFALMMLADDRAIASTYIHGQLAWQRDAHSVS